MELKQVGTYREEKTLSGKDSGIYVEGQGIPYFEKRRYQAISYLQLSKEEIAAFHRGEIVAIGFVYQDDLRESIENL